MQYLSKSVEETYQIAEKIAKQAEAGDCFALSGELGSGKTTFTKGFAKALGVNELVTSPTFVIMKKYDISNNKNKIKRLIHADCYRLNSPSEIESIGLSEYSDLDDSVIILEWPEKINFPQNKKIKKIFFEFVNESTRRISVGE